MWRVLTAVLAMVIVAGAMPLFRHVREVPPPPPPLVRSSFVAPPGAQLGAGDDVLDAAVSPDSRAVVFVATTNGLAELWHRRLDTDRAERLPGTIGASMPAWKWTGNVVSFFAEGRLKQIAIPDRSVRTLADAPRPAGAAWLPDGSLLFAADERGAIRRLAMNSPITQATNLKSGDRRHEFPFADRSGRFVYTAVTEAGRRVARLVTAAAERELTTTSSHAALIDDELTFVRDTTLMAQRLNAEAMRNGDGAILVGRARPLAFDVGVAPSGRGFFATSSRLLLWAAAASTARQLAWFDLVPDAREGQEPRAGRQPTIVAEPANYWQVRLSPDDFDAALTILDPLLRTLDVFVMPLTAVTAVPQRLTRALAADTDPVWSPRGDRILFRSMQGGRPDLFTRAVRGGSKDEPLLRSDLDETPSDWQRGGILFHAASSGALDVWSLVPGRATPTAITRSGFNEFDAHWSPDRRSIAYVSDESGQADIYVQDIDAPPGPSGAPIRSRVTLAGGTRPQWSRDGRALFFLREGQLLRADRTVEGFTTPLVVLQGTDVRDYSLAHRSDRVLLIVARARTELATAGMIVDWKN